MTVLDVMGNKAGIPVDSLVVWLRYGKRRYAAVQKRVARLGGVSYIKELGGLEYCPKLGDTSSGDSL